MMFFFCWPRLPVDIVFVMICGVVVVDEAVSLPADALLETKHTFFDLLYMVHCNAKDCDSKNG